jgi:ankyrin repeat protein
MNMKHLESLVKSTTKCQRKTGIDFLKKKQFFAAAKAGDEAKFRWYLEHGYPIETEDNEDKRDTVLIAACRVGRTNIVKLALEYGAKNDPHPEYGQTALQAAVAAGHIDCVKVLLETASLSKADKIIVNHEDHAKEAPLHVASRCGNVQIAQLLIKHGANIFCLDAKGRTCLHCAVQSGNEACLKYLLQVGGHQLINDRDQNGLTSLYMAIKQGNLNCAKILIQSGANLSASMEKGVHVLELAKRHASKKMVDLIYLGLRLQYNSEKSSTGRISDKNLEDTAYSQMSKYAIITMCAQKMFFLSFTNRSLS